MMVMMVTDDYDGNRLRVREIYPGLSLSLSLRGALRDGANDGGDDDGGNNADFKVW